MLAVVDTRPLDATVDADDQDHQRSLAVLRQPSLRFYIPALVVAETLKTDVIITLDRRHFSAVRPRHVATWRLLPDL
jgi:predicted nucleic acid-binding protein